MAGLAKIMVPVAFTQPQADALLTLALSVSLDYSKMKSVFEDGRQRQAAYRAIAKLANAALAAEGDAANGR